MEVSRIREMINKNEWNIKRKLGAESKNILKVSRMKNSKASNNVRSSLWRRDFSEQF